MWRPSEGLGRLLTVSADVSSLVLAFVLGDHCTFRGRCGGGGSRWRFAAIVATLLSLFPIAGLCFAFGFDMSYIRWSDFPWWPKRAVMQEVVWLRMDVCLHYYQCSGCLFRLVYFFS